MMGEASLGGSQRRNSYELLQTLRNVVNCCCNFVELMLPIATCIITTSYSYSLVFITAKQKLTKLSGVNVSDTDFLHYSDRLVVDADIMATACVHTTLCLYPCASHALCTCILSFSWQKTQIE